MNESPAIVNGFIGASSAPVAPYSSLDEACAVIRDVVGDRAAAAWARSVRAGEEPASEHGLKVKKSKRARAAVAVATSPDPSPPQGRDNDVAASSSTRAREPRERVESREEDQPMATGTKQVVEYLRAHPGATRAHIVALNLFTTDKVTDVTLSKLRKRGSIRRDEACLYYADGGVDAGKKPRGLAPGEPTKTNRARAEQRVPRASRAARTAREPAIAASTEGRLVGDLRAVRAKVVAEHEARLAKIDALIEDFAP